MRARRRDLRPRKSGTPVVVVVLALVGVVAGAVYLGSASMRSSAEKPLDAPAPESRNPPDAGAGRPASVKPSSVAEEKAKPQSKANAFPTDDEVADRLAKARLKRLPPEALPEGEALKDLYRALKAQALDQVRALHRSVDYGIAHKKSEAVQERVFTRVSDLLERAGDASIVTDQIIELIYAQEDAAESARKEVEGLGR